MNKVGLISLGCAKNRVDSEIMLASFVKASYQIVNNPKLADVIVINTCGFIKEAKQEAIDTILDMLQYQKKVIVTGCLVERYLDELKKNLPEVSLWIPFHDYVHFNEYVSIFLNENKDFAFNPLNRLLTTPKSTAYLRIAEGCNNFCSFCAIPYIRGRFHSRPIKELIFEANLLAKQGIKEINIIAQDVSAYGFDLKDGSNITKLLLELEKIKNIEHYRLLYLYPSEINDEFINFMKHSKKVYPYFDIPLQHSSDKILKLMNRKGNYKSTLITLNKIKEEIPNAIFRSTFIVGFPYENNSDFKNLISFIKEFKFDHAGAFIYSKEEGTASYKLDKQVNLKTKQNRFDIFMKEQATISYKNNLKHINEELIGLCINKNDKTNTYYFSTYLNAPDDIDGSVFAITNKPLEIGKYYHLKVKDAFVYDLLVEILK